MFRNAVCLPFQDFPQNEHLAAAVLHRLRHHLTCRGHRGVCLWPITPDVSFLQFWFHR